MENFEKISLKEMEAINGGFTQPENNGKVDIGKSNGGSATIVDIILKLFKGLICW